MNLKVKALSPKIGKEIPAPFYASAGAAAMDLHACVDEPITIPAGGRAVIPTGIAIALPSAQYVALVFARSGLGIKHGVAPANCVGVIDSDYRGEIMVGLQNSGESDYTIQPADRIAQLMITPVVQAQVELVDELDDTDRGACSPSRTPSTSKACSSSLRTVAPSGAPAASAPPAGKKEARIWPSFSPPSLPGGGSCWSRWVLLIF